VIKLHCESRYTAVVYTTRGHVSDSHDHRHDELEGFGKKRRPGSFPLWRKTGQTEVLQYHENGNSDREESTIVGYRVHLLRIGITIQVNELYRSACEKIAENGSSVGQVLTLDRKK
jgi:hypothetical protein